MPIRRDELCVVVSKEDLATWAERFYSIQSRNIMSKFMMDPVRSQIVIANIPEWSELCEHDKKLLIDTFKELFLELGYPKNVV